MTTAKGLVIREPWIDLILSGRKTWEMRAQPTSWRGWIGLIRKGSGRIEGIARIVDCGEPLTPDLMVATFDRHRIPEDMIRSGEVAKWTTPWVLADVRTLPCPVPYRHPNGAIKLFTLSEAESDAILTGTDESTSPSAESLAPELGAHPTLGPAHAVNSGSFRHAEDAHGRLLGETEITAANLKNNHFYLRNFLHRFPSDLIGGRDANPPVLAVVKADGVQPTSTDICQTHRFFRDRSWTRTFLAQSDAAPGDTVRVYETAPYRYTVTLHKRGTP